jgi:hypothetical protein
MWLPQRKAWAGLASIVMAKNTIITGGDTASETRYFISSLPLQVEEAARAIRSHWMVESYHWHLDVTFREDANHTMDKAAAYNLNINEPPRGKPRGICCSYIDSNKSSCFSS